MNWEMIAQLLQEFNPYSAAFRLLLAVIAGGCIGLERGRHGRAAGLRTHVLVCLGSAMTALVGLYVSGVLGGGGDPMRISAQVISGIGFLGAGTILTRRRSHITGLTTAAGLWTTASLGLMIAVGFYWAALVGFVLMLLTMTFLPILERKTKIRDAEMCYMELCSADDVHTVFDALEEQFDSMRLAKAQSGIPGRVGVWCAPHPETDVTELIHQIREQEEVALFIKSAPEEA
ncbi:MAG: MgtC/SapB family protein [Oscillospiraceae bacterium]|nr:MgtC/SapB family protein [Oscillospiraceae bacterium]